MSASAPLKILYIIDNFASPFAGTEGQLYKLIKGLDRTKYTPYLLLFRPSPYIENNGFPCVHTVLDCSKMLSPLTWLKLFQSLRRFKKNEYKLAHIFFNDPSIVAPPILKLLGMTSIISRRDMGYWYTPAYLAFLRFNSRLVDHVLVNSEAVKQITCEKEYYSRSKVSVIYNGYEDALQENTQTVSLKQDGAEVVIGIVANIRPIKRMQDAVEALAILNSSGNKCRLVIVGEGDSSSLEAQASRAGVMDYLHCVGAQSEPGAYIKGFDICLLCSESEGFSNAIIEYMQHEKPVVCSAVGGNPEIIIHGENGYIYPAGDVASLVDLLIDLLNEPQKRLEFGCRARETVLKNYGMAAMLSAHEVKYEGLLVRDIDL